MICVTKNFDENLKENIYSVKNKIREKYDLNPGNNINLICEKLLELKDKPGSYVECGVYQGNTLFTVAEHLKIIEDERDIYGFDTFEGFPDVKINKLDHPSMFRKLFEKGEITEDHYLKAREWTNNFEDLNHLTQDYFCDVSKVFDIADKYENIKLIKGPFVESLKKINNPIAVLFLDCDLYDSYMNCLSELYTLIIPGGYIIFDEYYSHKYPGARIAVNEFFKDKEGKFEMYKTHEGFERWCFIKES